MAYQPPSGIPVQPSAYALQTFGETGAPGPNGLSQVYGAGFVVGMRFRVPSVLSGFRIRFYGRIVGAPGPLTLRLTGDSNRHPSTTTTIEVQAYAATTAVEA